MRRALLLIVLVNSTVAVKAQHDELDAAIRDGVVNVVVLGPGDRPAPGIPVTCVFRAGEHLVPAVFGTPMIVSPNSVPPLDVVATTDSLGRATLEIGRAGVILGFFAGAVGTGELRVCVTIAAPMANAPVKEFRLDRLPKDAVQLACPATTALGIRITDAAGRPESRPAVVTASITDGSSSSRPLLRGIAVPVLHGEGGLPVVEIGQTIRLAARVEGEKLPRVLDMVVGPRQATGNSAELAPPKGDAAVELSLRILTSLGKPSANTTFEVSAMTGPALLDKELLPRRDVGATPRARRVGRTDQEGRMRLNFGGIADPDPWVSTNIRIRPVMPIILGLAVPCVGEVDLWRGLRSGNDDIGDVRLKLPSNIAQGRVINDALHPLGGVAVRVETLRTNLWGVGLEHLSEMGERLAFRPWVPVPEATAVSDGDGRFQVTGSLPRGQIRLIATKPGYAQVTAGLIESGRSGIIVPMIAACQLSGRVSLDPGISGDSISITVRGDPEAAVRRDLTAPAWSGQAIFERYGARTTTAVQSDGSFGFPTLAPGIGEVRVLVAAVPALELPSVQFEIGETTRPAELNPLDLRGKVYKRVFHVTDPDGAPVPDATVSLYIEDEEFGPTRAQTDAAGNAVFFLPGTRSATNRRMQGQSESPKVDAGVYRSTGFRDASVRNVTSDTAIVLERKRFARVYLKNTVALPRPPFMLSCVVDPEGFKSEQHNYPFGDSERGAQLGPLGVGQVDIKAPGRYTVRLLVWVLMPDLGWDIPVEFAGPRTVALAADGKDQIEIDVEPAAVDAAIRKAVASTFPKRTPPATTSDTTEEQRTPETTASEKPEGERPFEDDYDGAIAQAKMRGLPLLVAFIVSTDPNGQQERAIIFNINRNTRELLQRFVVVFLQIDSGTAKARNLELMAKLGLQKLGPTYVVLDPTDGHSIAQWRCLAGNLSSWKEQLTDALSRWKAQKR